MAVFDTARYCARNAPVSGQRTVIEIPRHTCYPGAPGYPGINTRGSRRIIIGELTKGIKLHWHNGYFVIPAEALRVGVTWKRCGLKLCNRKQEAQYRVLHGSQDPHYLNIDLFGFAE
eukprot:2643519-Rhodomonas_salina.1